MKLDKLEEKNIERARKLVESAKDDISRNQTKIVHHKEQIKRLIEFGQGLAEELAAAQEYLDDLEAARDN